MKVFAILRQFQCDVYSVNTRFTLTKDELPLTKEQFMHNKIL